VLVEIHSKIYWIKIVVYIRCHNYSRKNFISLYVRMLVCVSKHLLFKLYPLCSDLCCSNPKPDSSELGMVRDLRILIPLKSVHVRGCTEGKWSPWDWLKWGLMDLLLPVTALHFAKRGTFYTKPWLRWGTVSFHSKRVNFASSTCKHLLSSLWCFLLFEKNPFRQFSVKVLHPCCKGGVNSSFSVGGSVQRKKKLEILHS
jgi:hypothetical protein